ncbi:MAG: BatA and WFA domain-containing protein [Phycisphaeraceae bacterium]|nr:BatA and WFA domain-containing protein [Phycisphaeraceae bacterium]
MTFLHTSLLAAGLACIAIPIIIHLLMNRRRKPVMWGAMRFLQEAFRRTRRRLLLEKYLLLATRCLLVALVALALARPLVGALGASGSQGRTFYLLIDNSLASGATDDAGRSALDRHKAAAREALGALSADGGDRVAVIALGAPAEALVLPPAHDPGAVAAVIDSIAPTAARADFAGAMALVAGSLRPEGAAPSTDTAAPPRADRAVVLMLSDFLEGSADLGPDSGAPSASFAGVRLPRGVTLIASEPAARGVSNVSVVGVEPLRSVVLGGAQPGEARAGEQVRVSLRRSGPGIDAPLATTVRALLAAPGSADSAAAESRTVVRWNPGQETATTAIALPPTPAAMHGGGGAVITVSIDRDALSADNTWRRPVEVRDSLRVGVIAPTRFGRAGGVDRLDAAAWIRIALAPRAESAQSGGEIEVVNIEPASIDSARLAGMDAVFLPRPDLLAEGAWARVRLFVDNGGLAVVFPPPGVSVHLWGDAFAAAMQPGWTPARQAIELAPRGGAGARLVAPTGAPSARGSAPARLLSLIEGELEELLRPVGVWRALPIEGSAAQSGETLLALPDGSPALWAGPIGVREAAPADGALAADTSARGVLAYFAVALDLEWTDLPTKPLAVPLLNELALQGVGRARGASWAIAGARPNVGRRVAELARIHEPDQPPQSAEVVAIDAEGLAREAVRAAGLWASRDERGTRRALLAVNPDPAAGRAGAQPRDAVGAWLAGAVERADDTAAPGATSAVVWLPTGAAAPGGAEPRAIAAALRDALGAGAPRSPISLPLLACALAVALLEMLLARWASHASLVTSAAPAGGAPVATIGGAA